MDMPLDVLPLGRDSVAGRNQGRSPGCGKTRRAGPEKRSGPFCQEMGSVPIFYLSRRSTPMGVAPLSVMKKVYTEFGCSVMLPRVSTIAAVDVLVMSN